MKILEVGFIRETQYPKWLANVVVIVPKKIEKWRICMEYTNMNDEACLKDWFPLPQID